MLKWITIVDMTDDNTIKRRRCLHLLENQAYKGYGANEASGEDRSEWRNNNSMIINSTKTIHIIDDDINYCNEDNDDAKNHDTNGGKWS